MVECDRLDVVCLHLAAHDDAREQTPVPTAVTATGIGDVLELGDTATSRVSLLRDLDSLQQAGLVVAEERPVQGYDEPRTIYCLTDEGREYAETVRERVQDATVPVTSGTTEDVPLADIERYLKGSDNPLVTALARLIEQGEVRLERHVTAEFVDHTDELARIREGIEASITRSNRTVVVSGAAGMGKTAIVREAVSRVTDDHEDVVVATGTNSVGAAAPYDPLRQAFETLPGGDALRSHLADVQTEFAPDDPEKIEVQRTALFEDITEDLRLVATEQPVVLFLENLQWADEATLELFAYLATTLDEWVHPVAFVGTYRKPAVAGADDHPLPPILERLRRESEATEVHLASLSWADTRALIADVVGHQQLPDAFVDLVYEQTGGNPLFIRETATYLLETGQVSSQEDRYPTDTSEVTLPEEVTEQIDKRLETLDERSRELLELGAVLGERIPGRVLAAASELPTPERREYTDLLVASRIWESADEDAAVTQHRAGDEVNVDGSGALQFVSSGLREAVAERLPAGRAQEYHRRIAEAFVEVAGPERDEQTARIAYHYEQAGEYEPAIDYYRRAGDHARDTYANEDAIENYERALDLARGHAADETTLATIHADIADVYRATGAFDSATAAADAGLDAVPDDTIEQCRLLGIISSVEFRQGRHDEAWETARRQQELAVDLDNREFEAKALRRLGQVAWRRGEFDEAREYFERGLAIARELDDLEHEASSLNNLGAVLCKQSEFDQAEERFERSLAIARERGDRHQEGDVLNNLGLVADFQSDLETAREYYEESLAIAEEIGDRQREGTNLGNLGLVAKKQGEYDQAREYYEESLAIARELGDRQREANNLGNLGGLASRLGEFDAAREYHEQSLALERELGNRAGEGSSLSNLGGLAQAQGDYDQAREYYEQSRDIHQDIGDRRGVCLAIDNLGEIARFWGEHERARATHEEALEIAQDIGDKQLEASALNSLGAVAREQNEGDEATEYFERALEMTREQEYLREKATSLQGLGTVTQQQGDLERAREYLDEALAHLKDTADPSHLAKCRLARGRLAFERGNHETAREQSRRALDRSTELGISHWEGRSRLLLGRIAAAEGSPATARDHWQTALERFESVGAPQDALETHRYLVETCHTQGDDEQARQWCQQAATLLDDAPEATAKLHREWVTQQCSE
jgi:predicted ATPase